MQSGHDLVGGQSPQAPGISGPVAGRVGGDAPIVVQIYALGRGVSLKRYGDDLAAGEGSFELESNGKVLVFDPLGAVHAHGFVTPVEGDVAAVSLSLQAVDQEHLAEFGHGVSHDGAPFKTVILCLPQGFGKTRLAGVLAAELNCQTFVDDWRAGLPLVPGALHLTNDAVMVDGLPVSDIRTDRERMVLAVLAAILLEVCDHQPTHSADSYLPDHLIIDAIEAFKGYGWPA